MTGLLGTAYSVNQASYDLARLFRNGIVARIPHRNLYVLTPDGLRFAIFYTKVHDRVLRPLMAGDQPQTRPRSATRSASSTTRSSAGSPQRDSPQPPDQPRHALIPGYPAGNSNKRQSPRTQAPATAAVFHQAAEGSEAIMGSLPLSFVLPGQVGSRARLRHQRRNVQRNRHRRLRTAHANGRGRPRARTRRGGYEHRHGLCKRPDKRRRVGSERIAMQRGHHQGAAADPHASKRSAPRQPASASTSAPTPST